MSSLYQSMVAVIEQSITPLAAKLGQQKYVIAIRDGFTAALPFMIIGSFMLVFIFPPFSADTTNSFARGWLERTDGRLVPTELGRRFTNDVVELFLD